MSNLINYTPELGYSYIMYSKTTNGVTVTVIPYFLDDQSSPQENHFVWAYQVNIKIDLELNLFHQA